MHKVFVRDIIAVEREVVLPDHCPKCRADFSPGSTNVQVWSLRPMLEKVRLTTVTTAGKTSDVFETKQVTQRQEHTLWQRLPCVFRCAVCGHKLAEYLQRTWVLEALDAGLAAQLRTLLYDANVLDPVIKKKVWGTTGSSTNCVACRIEAALRTEEVPQPIDARVHTCPRTKNELNA